MYIHYRFIPLLAPIEVNILWSEAEEIETDSGISSK